VPTVTRATTSEKLSASSPQQENIGAAVPVAACDREHGIVHAIFCVEDRSPFSAQLVHDVVSIPSQNVKSARHPHGARAGVCERFRNAFRRAVGG